MTRYCRKKKRDEKDEKPNEGESASSGACAFVVTSNASVARDGKDSKLPTRSQGEYLLGQNKKSGLSTVGHPGILSFATTA